MRRLLASKKKEMIRFDQWYGVPTNTDLRFEDGEVYVRLAMRFIAYNPVALPVLDLARFVRYARADNITYNPHIQSSGWLRRMIAEAEKTGRRLGAHYIYIEQVLNEWMPAWLERNKFIRDDRMPHDNNWYREIVS